MNDKSIDSKKQTGDWKVVAQILGKSTEACREAYKRKDGKTYEIVRETLIKVIENRESFVQQETVELKS